MKWTSVSWILLGLFFGMSSELPAQRHLLFGDVRFSEEKAPAPEKHPMFRISLTNLMGQIREQQVVGVNGRYRFLDVPNGDYYLVVEMGDREVARVRLLIQELRSTDLRHDLELEWRPWPGEQAPESGSAPPSLVYARTPSHQMLFEEAQHEMSSRNIKRAIQLLTEVVAADPNDFEAWTELGTLDYMNGNSSESESHYLTALTVKSDYLPALVNLGKLRFAQGQYPEAIEVLGRAVQVDPRSVQAQYFLGEAYLQTKKGSKAVVHLNEALRLEPLKMAEIHLRLAALYDAAGMKQRAADEYRQFLAKRPDDPQRKKLEEYISQNP